ncbi:hypothetical protein [Marinomonas mediterranea]|uniref:cyanobactin maturation protease PatG family protein n=1 Tax=Marinomonas mediterranea TaxID=119864 RepID=UPI00234982F5|nr:hypothetical protein [Marinomonas mediterranea]WCN09889.1 hypothetical protein GV055_13670 [Marinomonas mediterranea]
MNSNRREDQPFENAGVARYRSKPSIVIQREPFQSEMELGVGVGQTDKEYVYVVGSVNAYFPNLGVEKEFYQACLLTGVDVSSLENINDEVSLARLNQSDSLSATLHQGFSKPENAYVAREMSWVFSNVDSNEVYRIFAESDESLMQLVAALGAKHESIIMIGQLTGNGHVLLSNLIPIKSTPVRASLGAKSGDTEMLALAEEILSLNANNGLSNQERALNYLLYNNTKIYTESYDFCYKANASGPNPSGYQLVSVDLLLSWSGDRLVSKVVFNYQGINTGAKQSWYSTVDVTGEYPFMLTDWKRFLPQY